VTREWKWALDRFVIISAACVTSGGWSSSANFERPLACASDADCPQFGGPNGSFQCRNTLCQSRDTSTYPLTSLDGGSAYELCYGSFARADTLDLFGPIGQEVSDWVATACPSGAASCTLPLPGMCLQP
jgi:hypothetical protein